MTWMIERWIASKMLRPLVLALTKVVTAWLISACLPEANHLATMIGICSGTFDPVKFQASTAGGALLLLEYVQDRLSKLYPNLGL